MNRLENAPIAPSCSPRFSLKITDRLVQNKRQVGRYTYRVEDPNGFDHLFRNRLNFGSFLFGRSRSVLMYDGNHSTDCATTMRCIAFSPSERTLSFVMGRDQLDEAPIE